MDLHIVCRKCKSEYFVSPELIPDDGRVVECSNCGDEWYVAKAAPVASAAAAAPPQPGARPAPSVSPDVSRILQEEAARDQGANKGASPQPAAESHAHSTRREWDSRFDAGAQGVGERGSGLGLRLLMWVAFLLAGAAFLINFFADEITAAVPALGSYVEPFVAYSQAAWARIVEYWEMFAAWAIEKYESLIL